MTLAAGTLLGPYQIIASVGAGAMGEVYRARDTRLDRTVAIKVLHPADGGDAAARERFEREARAASSLNHPHICALYDIGREGTLDFLVMEFLEGETLAARIAAGPLGVDQVVRYGVEIAAALESAHGRHLVHRDLKPGNVMVTSAGAKLLDFGLVKRTAPTPGGMTDATRSVECTQPGIVVGTVSYMSPEQARGLPVDPRTDLFSLGVVLYELLTGRRPFSGDTAADIVSAILGAEPTRPSAVIPRVSAELERIVGKAMQKDPADRYQTAQELGSDLRALRQELEGAVAPADRDHRPSSEFTASTEARGDATRPTARTRAKTG